MSFLVYESNSDKCLKWFLTPFYWMWRSFDIYFLGCSAFYCSRCATCVEKLVCCVPCGVECYFFEDKSFPPNAKSLGFYDGSDGKTENYEWKRAKEFFPDHVPSCKNPVLNFLVFILRISLPSFVIPGRILNNRDECSRKVRARTKLTSYLL